MCGPGRREPDTGLVSGATQLPGTRSERGWGQGPGWRGLVRARGGGGRSGPPGWAGVPGEQAQRPAKLEAASWKLNSASPGLWGGGVTQIHGRLPHRRCRTSWRLSRGLLTPQAAGHGLAGPPRSCVSPTSVLPHLFLALLGWKILKPGTHHPALGPGVRPRPSRPLLESLTECGLVLGPLCR